MIYLKHLIRPALRVVAPAIMAAAMSAVGAACSSAQSGVGGEHLPLREIIATRPAQRVFAVFITGDGGWASIDKTIAADLAEHGISVVGIDSRAYLHERRTPERVATDVSGLVRDYQAKWQTARFALIGYSRGADLAPFIVSRMDSSLRGDLTLVAMIGLGERAGFEFHFEDIFRDVKRPGDLPTLPEVRKLRGTRMLCVYGQEEKESGCRDAEESLMQRIAKPGTHHFNGEYRAIGDIIVAALR